jgi:hypothetical protein
MVTRPGAIYSESQTWRALHKIVKGYVITENNMSLSRYDTMQYIIQKLVRELGLTISFFPGLGLALQGYRYADSENMSLPAFLFCFFPIENLLP